MTPGEQARAIVRAGLTDVRIWLGETTEVAEQYRPRHARAVWTPLHFTVRIVREEIPC